MSLQGNGKGRLMLAGALVLALVMPQALVAKDGWDLTIEGSAGGKVVTGMRPETSQLGPVDHSTAAVAKATPSSLGNDAELNADVTFTAAHEYGGVMVTVAFDSDYVNQAEFVANNGPNAPNGTFNLKDFYPIRLDKDTYVWMHFLAPFGIAMDQADLMAKVGFFSGRATVAEAVVDDEGMGVSWGDEIKVGDDWLTAPKIDDPANAGQKIADPKFAAIKLRSGAVGQLDLKILDMIIWRSLVFLGDWNQHDRADISTGLLLDKLTLAEGHTLKASVSYAADLRDMSNSNYQLKNVVNATDPTKSLDGNTDTKTVDTLTIAAGYDGDLGNMMMLKVRGDVGFNNLVRWENDKAEPDGTTGPNGEKLGGEKLKSNQMFIGWHGGVGFSLGDWVFLGVDLGGRTAQKAEFEFDPDNDPATDNSTKEIHPSQLIQYYIPEVNSSFVKALTNGDVMLNLFVRAVLDTTQSNYLLRSLEFGGQYDVVKSDEGNLWVKLGYGLVLEDPDQDGRYGYDTDYMKEETAGLYFKAGGDFKKMW